MSYLSDWVRQPLEVYRTWDGRQHLYEVNVPGPVGVVDEVPPEPPDPPVVVVGTPIFPVYPGVSETSGATAVEQAIAASSTARYSYPFWRVTTTNRTAIGASTVLRTARVTFPRSKVTIGQESPNPAQRAPAGWTAVTLLLSSGNIEDLHDKGWADRVLFIQWH